MIIITWGEMLPGSGGWRPGVRLSLLQWAGQPPTPVRTVQPKASVVPRSRDLALFSSSRSPDQEPTVAPRCLAFSTCLQGLGSPVAVGPAPPARPACPTEASRVGAVLHVAAVSGLRLLPALDLLSTFSSDV